MRAEQESGNQAQKSTFGLLEKCFFFFKEQKITDVHNIQA